ncbi:LysR family transcriptional regulator [Pedobacter arcticus]|uniref:LysR family transcriptional regulator n=1 Tax=Pedobacter arcticus TaxID=752140 RepID=UPI0003137C78|nr:LysR family transcriptional regulator [Pedobacter arcticus]
MLNFRLQVFYTTAKRLNFTKAAAELFITQPAVTKHIHELENHFKLKLFDRNGSKIALTDAGKLLLKHTEKLIAFYKDLEFDMNTLNDEHKGVLKIGASSTIAQYVLPEILAKFHQQFTDVKIQLISGNTEHIEQALLNREIDLGLIEGRSKSPQISYTHFLDDELVLVCNNENQKVKGNTSIEALKTYQFLLREPGSGSLEVVAHALKEAGIKISDLQIEMQLGNIESIKAYLQNSDCLAFISIHAVLKELKHHKLRIVDVNNFSIERPLFFVQKQGDVAKLPEVFIKFASKYNLK